MPHVLAVALASMQQDMQRLDRVAQNLANATTPGYKREVVAARPFAEAVAAGLEGGEPALPVGPAAGGVEVLADLRPGTVKVTGQPLDLAIAGDGFFEVATESGPAYTRQGSFQVDGRGRLVTAQGHAVMGRSGEILLTTRTPVIDAAGNVTEPDATTGPAASAPGTPVAQLRVVRMEEPRAARRIGEGLLLAGGRVTEVGEGQAGLRQGALENSNVSSVQEMVQLIQTMRHFESMQKVAQGYDEMLGAAIRKLGDL
jgi:flagellar basal-body rod protein FlgG